jgi:NAD(P)-dependent dehydrogenase (short-subunit alcohol dehydrogenase family)
MKFNKKLGTAIITGGDKGVGRSIVIELAKAGYNIAFTYSTNLEKAKDTLNYINEISNVKCKYYKLDVRTLKEIKKVFKIINNDFNKIKVLVNNAGINNPTDFDKTKLNDWNNILSVNLTGPFLCSKEILKYMKENGSIIHIGSVSGQYGGPRTAHYASSKAGLLSLSQVIARFVAPKNIRSNVVSAGLIESEMAASGMQSKVVQQASENIILKRFGTRKEVANVVRFLASKESSYITAQVINVNGGLYF